MLHYLCNTTCYNYLLLSTRYTFMLFCLYVSLIYITLPARYTLMFLGSLYHPAVIVQNLLIQ